MIIDVYPRIEVIMLVGCVWMQIKC